MQIFLPLMFKREYYSFKNFWNKNDTKYICNLSTGSLEITDIRSVATVLFLEYFWNISLCKYGSVKAF